MLARRVAILLLISVASLASCKREPAAPPDVVVRVDDRMITLGNFKRYLERNAGTDLSQLRPEVASAMLDQFVDEVIVSEYAAAEGIEVPSEKITAAVRTEGGATVLEKRDEMRRAQIIADLSAEVPEPSPAQIRAYYDQHQNEFRSGEQVRVRQILVNDEALAQKIQTDLKKGAVFGELSAQHSRAPNAQRGGEIGFVSRGELPKMFEDVIFRLEPGQVSDVVSTDASYHIFLVEERRPAGVASLEEAGPLITTRLKEDAIRQRLAQLVSAQRKEMRVAVLIRRLPFPYTGTLPKASTE